MITSSSPRTVDTRLGTYLAIFTSGFVALSILALILAALGNNDDTLTAIVILLPLVAMTLIGITAYAGETDAYFVASRRVPAFFSGIASAVIIPGAAGLSGLTGALFIIGFDAFALAIGFMLGVVALAILVVPYFRKFGGHTLVSFLGRRFQSRRVRSIAAIALLVPLAMLLIAELSIGVNLLARMLGSPAQAITPVMASAIALAVGLSGMRGVSAAGAGAGVLAAIAVFVPAAIVSTLLTNLPLAPLTYGAMLNDVARQEAVLGLASRPAPWLGVDLPGHLGEVLERPFLAPFSSIGEGAFLLLALSIMAGVVAIPSVVARAGTAPSVLDSRKACGWVIVTIGAFVLFLPATIIFVRHEIFTDVVGKLPSDLPIWLADFLSRTDVVRLASDSRAIAVADMTFQRDGVALLLAGLYGLPRVMVDAVAVGLIAVAAASASAHAHAVGTMVTDDLILAGTSGLEKSMVRSIVARVMTGVAIALAASLGTTMPVDPLRLMLLAFTIAGATGFVVIVLSIWWKRFSNDGATFAITTGFGLSSAYVFMTEGLGMPWIMNLDPILVGPIVALAAAGGGALISLASERPTKDIREFVRDIRVPGGEALYDRERRLAATSRRRA